MILIDLSMFLFLLNIISNLIYMEIHQLYSKVTGISEQLVKFKF